MMIRSCLGNRYVKWSSRENYFAYKRSKIICANMTKFAKNEYFEKATKDGMQIFLEYNKTFIN